MLASVVIPSLNRGAILLNTLASVMEQNGVGEILVVDQTSRHAPDDERRLGALHSRGAISWIRQREPSASAARNRGITAARHEIVLLLDDDVLVESNLVAEHIKCYADTSVDYVCGRVIPPDGSIRFSLHPLACDPDFGWLYFPMNYAFPAPLASGNSSNLSVRRSAALQVGGMDENFTKGAHNEEADFCLRLNSCGFRGIFQPRASVRTLSHPTGGIRSWKGSFDPAHHHLVGQTYFILQHATPKTTLPMLGALIRRQIAQPTRSRPWMLPVTLCRSAVALGQAMTLKIRGRRCLPKSND